MSISTETSKQANQKINDPAGTFFAYLWVGLFGFIAMYSFGMPIDVLITPFLTALTYIFYLTAKTKAKGTTISIDDKTISYPGGSIAAESVKDYFTSSYWLQCTKTHTTKFEDITQLSTTVNQTIFNKLNKFLRPPTVSDNGHVRIVKTRYKYGVEIQGTFGAATIYFKSSQKRDQLFGLLRQYLKAGVPAVIVNAQD